MGNEICSCHRQKKPISNGYFKSNHDSVNNETSIQYEPPTDEFRVSPTPYVNLESPIVAEKDDNIINAPLKTSSTPETSSTTIVHRNGGLLSPRESQYRYTSEQIDLSDSPKYLSSSPDQQICLINFYQSLFKDFLRDYYPINSNIIKQMVEKNFMTVEDAEIINQCRLDIEKSQRFMDLFVFSDENLYKLADFLFIITEENYESLLRSYNYNPDYYFSLVDLLYYIFNCITLFHDINSGEMDYENFLHQFISAIRIKKPKLTSDIFLLQIQMNNLIFSSKFWSGFCLINQTFKSCEELLVSHCNLQSHDLETIVSGFMNHPNLKKLDFSSNPIENRGINHLANLFTSQNTIQYLNIACCSITATGMEHFIYVLMRSDLTLKELNISYNDIVDLSEDCISKLAVFSLIRLSLQSTNMTYQYKLFESIKMNYSLRTIDLSRNRLQSKDIRFLASGIAYNFHLKHLVLSMIGLTKLDCSTLNAALLMNKSVVVLDLSDNHLGDEGMQILTDLLTMKRTLKELILKRCNISPIGILNVLRKAAESRCHLRLIDLCFNYSPRLSVAMDLMTVRLKIRELLADIGRLKRMNILLYGTIEEDMLLQQKSLRDYV